MTTPSKRVLLAIVLACSGLIGTNQICDQWIGKQAVASDRSSEAHTKEKMSPPSLDEARSRAKLLHETIHGALQVMHRDLFREDEKLAIPSQSLEDVFDVLAEEYGVKVRWLAVDTEAMNVDHKAQTEVEKSAVKALATGKKEFEATDGDVYHRAAPIRLASQCLKCHLPNRMDTKDRFAGLVISLPYKK